MHNDSIALVLSARKPSNIIEMLRKTRKLDQQISDLIGVPQDKDHHPEGDAYTHTLMVLDEAAEISEREFLNNTDNAILRLAALAHDFGKFTSTQISPDGKITAYGHPEAGLQPALEFMQNSNVNPIIINQVLPLVNLHMAWVGFYMQDITSKAVRRLVRRVEPSNLQMLAYVVEADMSGRGGKYFKQGLPQRMLDIMDVAATLDNPVDQYPEPIIDGHTIMAYFDIGPSPLLGKIKAALYKAQLEGRFTEKTASDFLRHNIKILEKL